MLRPENPKQQKNINNIQMVDKNYSKLGLIIPTVELDRKSCETILMIPSNYKVYSEEEIHQIKANSFSSSLVFLILSLCFFGLLYFYLFKLL